ncbi:MAG TPA: DUF928 domain-containing protein [Leptolyngbyaceae cyanobacterium]
MSATLPATASIKDTSVSLGLRNRSETILAQRRSRLRFKVPGIRPSLGREGGLSRSSQITASCDGQQISMTSLLPRTNLASLPKDKIEIESTVAPRPTFFVHVSQTSGQKAEFMLVNEKGEEVYKNNNITLSGSPGIISISLPANAPALEVGKSYYWSLTAICDDDWAKNPAVDGWVKRIELNSTLANQLNRAAPRDRPVLYADASIWTDALTALADLRKANPNDVQLRQDWEDLLKSVGLDTVAQATLIGSVSGINRN